MNPSFISPHQGITLSLGLFFDGTGHNLFNHEQGVDSGHGSGSYALGKSNVARLYPLYSGPATTLALYIEGVGTCEGAADSLLSQATAV